VKKPINNNVEAPVFSMDQVALLRAFCESRGIDLDKPMDKTIKRLTLDEKNRQHQEWHCEFEKFLSARKS
jgi:hypothetical protein